MTSNDIILRCGWTMCVCMSLQIWKHPTHGNLGFNKEWYWMWFRNMDCHQAPVSPPFQVMSMLSTIVALHDLAANN